MPAYKNISPDIVADVKSKKEPYEMYMSMLPFIRISSEQEQKALEQKTLDDLGRTISAYLQAALEVESVVEHVRDDVQLKMQQNQKDWFISEQIRMLQREITDGEIDEVEKLAQKIKDKHFSPAIQEKLDEELGRMRQMQPASPEYAVSRNYIDWFLAMPYGIYTDSALDLRKVKKNWTRTITVWKKSKTAFWNMSQF